MPAPEEVLTDPELKELAIMDAWSSAKAAAREETKKAAQACKVCMHACSWDTCLHSSVTDHNAKANLGEVKKTAKACNTCTCVHTRLVYIAV